MHNRDSVDPAHRHHRRTSTAFFPRSLDIAAKAGIARDKIVLDPGIGFGKTPEQSMIALARLREFDVVRPADPGRRLAQALHRLGVAVGAATSGSAARSPRI